MKVWTSSQNGDDKLIVFANQAIYKGSSKLADVERAVLELKASDSTPKELTGVPFSYIREINLQDRKNYIEILFGKESTEELKISDAQMRSEIFEYLKSNIPNSEYSHVKLSALQAGKKPLIAFCVATAIFLWTLYIAMGIESGYRYDVPGQHYNSLAGIVLAIASFGVKNVVLIFSPLILIAIISFIKMAKNPPVINRLRIHH